MNSNSKIPVKTYLTTNRLFTISLSVVVLTILAIWLFGLGEHRSIFENSILSTSILSGAFILFLTISLYKGIKLKDDLGKITDGLKLSEKPDLSAAVDIAVVPSDLGGEGEGVVAILLGILAWILFSILLVLFIWFFGVVFWAMILVFIAMLYWIFFRALRLVFKNSNKCKGDLGKSLAYGVGYTVLYNCWIYGIILVTHYLDFKK